jgi:hypothetical protein
MKEILCIACVSLAGVFKKQFSTTDTQIHGVLIGFLSVSVAPWLSLWAFARSYVYKNRQVTL